MSEPSDELLRIAASYSPKIRNALIQSYREFLQYVSEQKITQVLLDEGLPGVLALADELGDSVSANVTPLLTDAWRDSGRKITSVLPNDALIAPFSFDTARVSALSASEDYRAAFVVDITQRQRETINGILTRGLMERWATPQFSRAIRASIGLTATQEYWVENYRRQLSTMDPAALERALRDRRSDQLYRRLIDSGDFLSAAQIDSMVERYRQRMVKRRAESIGRTESIRAMRMGEYESLLAAYEQGALSDKLRRFWVTAQDEKVRIYHVPIPNMNPDGRAIDEAFETPLGLMRYPLDPNGVAKNVIQCRCRVVYRMPDAFGEYQDVPISGTMPVDVSGSLSEL